MECFLEKLLYGDWINASATLITGLLAVVAARLTIKEMKRSTVNQIKNSNQTMNQQLKAAAHQTRKQIKATFKVARFDAYLRFGERWDSTKMMVCRNNLVKLILKRDVILDELPLEFDDEFLLKYCGYIETVIGFFEDMGASRRYKAINNKMIENGYSNVIVTYWLCVGEAYSKYMNRWEVIPESGVYYEEFRHMAETIRKRFDETTLPEDVKNALESELELTTLGLKFLP